MTPHYHEIFAAIAGGNISRLQSLLDEDADAMQIHDAVGVSPLLYAVYRGKDEVIQAMLRQRAPSNIWDAAAVGSTEVVAIEIQKSPDAVRQISEDGWLPLHLACFFGHLAAARLLVEHSAAIDAVSGGFHVTPLQSALARGNDEIACMLIEHGAKEN